MNKVEHLQYLGSVVNTDGSFAGEVAKRIQAGWMGWRRISGVLCD